MWTLATTSWVFRQERTICRLLYGRKPHPTSFRQFRMRWGMRSFLRSLLVVPFAAALVLPAAAQQEWRPGPRLVAEAEHVDSSQSGAARYMTAAHKHHRRNVHATTYHRARSKKKSAAIVGGSALGGAALGGLAGGGKGAAIGAAAGAGGGYLYDHKTNHRNDAPR